VIPLDLYGKVVVITGATEGFGAEAAQAFCGEGASLVLAARPDDVAGEFARDCEAQGGRALVVPTVANRRAGMKRLAHRAVHAFGRIDVWVNTPGLGALGSFHEIPLTDHVEVIESTLLGTLYGSYFALRQFQRQEYGILINLAPVVGRAVAPWYASGAAAEQGVVGLGAALRQELRDSGLVDVRVCTVLPASVEAERPELTLATTAPEPPWLAAPYDPRDVADTIVRLATAPEDEVTVRPRLIPIVTGDLGGNGRHLPAPPDARAPGRGGRAGAIPTPEAARAGAAYMRLESPPA
jgi:NADP-dependent 3-hydroxy acid dehydrogenase YdfG